MTTNVFRYVRKVIVNRGREEPGRATLELTINTTTCPNEKYKIWNRT